MSLLAYAGDVAEIAEEVVDVPYLQIAGELEEEDRALTKFLKALNFCLK